jgi:CheY-like chemotaxis protein
MVSAHADAASSGRVLVVDDDPTVSDVVRRYLERA